MKALFVGGKPSDFKSKVLDQWVVMLDVGPDNYLLISSSDEYFIDCAKSFYNQHKPIVALGLPAAEALKKAGIPNFCMPAPVDKESKDLSKLALTLARCKQYIKAHEFFRQS